MNLQGRKNIRRNTRWLITDKIKTCGPSIQR
nr:MAG TPA: hypothetical protein [Caudoviricetes sp.]